MIRKELTRDDLIRALLEAPLPLINFVGEKDEIADPDYKAWYDDHVAPLHEAIHGGDKT